MRNPRFVSSKTLFAHDTAIGNDEAGFYVGDSPQADTVVRDDQAFGNQFGIFIRYARHVLVTGNVVSGNCQGILVLDDGQQGGAGNAAIQHNRVFNNNKLCKKSEDTPVDTKGGGILLLGATHTLVTHNSVTGNAGKKFNSGGIVVLSAKPLTGGSNPNFDTISFNSAFRNHPADLIWDRTGVGVRFKHNAEKWCDGGLIATELQRFRLQYWSLPEFGHLLADAGYTDISVTADYRDDHRPGPDSHVWTFHAVRPR